MATLKKNGGYVMYPGDTERAAIEAARIELEQFVKEKNNPIVLKPAKTRSKEEKGKHAIYSHTLKCIDDYLKGGKSKRRKSSKKSRKSVRRR
jgi:hypothetical protein